jgi:hypothetical protein
VHRVLAMLLAISGGRQRDQRDAERQHQSSDTFAFYQARAFARQHSLAVDSLQTVLLTQPGFLDDARAQIQERIDQ